MFRFHSYPMLMANLGEISGKGGGAPAGRGGAGTYLEGQIGAFYLLAMLAGAEPRGLPGTTIDRVRFQGDVDGFSLDDVVVEAKGPTGGAVLEIQSKRTIKFSPKEALFKEVCGQIAKAVITHSAAEDTHQLAVASARTSFRISGPYQEVLTWARSVPSAEIFFARLSADGVSSPDMREFADTFRRNLVEAGVADDDQRIWQVLRNFQILEFDFEATASLVRNASLDRARMVLAPENAEKAAALWSGLTDIALNHARVAGVVDLVTLRREVTNLGFRLAGHPDFSLARMRLTEMARHTLADIGDKVADVHLPRTAAIAQISRERDDRRYIEIRGGPGTGKSAMLRSIALTAMTEARVIFLDPLRTPAGGWAELASRYGIAASAREFLSDLAASGSSILFIDSVEMFSDERVRATVNDILREVSAIDGFTVLVSARSDFDAEEPNWLAADARERLGSPGRIDLEDLSDEEVGHLVAAAPELRVILAADHPAAAVARNLYRLSRLLTVGSTGGDIRTEADLARMWWDRGDGVADENRRARQRLLAALADASIKGEEVIELQQSSDALNQLLASQTLREAQRDQFAFRHDVLRDWAVGSRLLENLDHCARLPLTRTAPARLARGVEIAARLALEAEDGPDRWIALLQRLSGGDVHHSWRRHALLAIVRSEAVSALLEAATPRLLGSGGSLLVDLSDSIIAVDTRSFNDWFGELAEAQGQIFNPMDVSVRIAASPSIPHLLAWCVTHRTTLPFQSLLSVIKLASTLLYPFTENTPLHSQVASMLYGWLIPLDTGAIASWGPIDREGPDLSYDQRLRIIEAIREVALSQAHRAPALAKAYLKAITSERSNREKINDVRRYSEILSLVAPAELAACVEWRLTEVFSDEVGVEDSRHNTFGMADFDYSPASPAQGPFLALLNSAPQIGLPLIRRLVGYSFDFYCGSDLGEDDGYLLLFEDGPRFFPCRRTYFWPRGQLHDASSLSALRALEAWGHARLDGGESPQTVIDDILGPDGSCAAYVMVAIDLILSHWPKTRDVSCAFAGCPELLVDDRLRHAQEGVGLSEAIAKGEPRGRVTMDDLSARPSRKIPLENCLITFTSTDQASDRVRQKLKIARDRLGSYHENANFGDPEFMVEYALNLTDQANYAQEGNGFRYVSPPAEVAHLANIQKGMDARMQRDELVASISLAVSDRRRGSSDLAERAVQDANGKLPYSGVPASDQLRSIHLVSCAMVAARDGDAGLVAAHESWIRAVIDEALESPEDITRRRQPRLDFNRRGQALNALIHLWVRFRRDADLRQIMEVVADQDPSGAVAISASLDDLIEADARLPKAILRCALATRTSLWMRRDRDRERVGRLAAAYAEGQRQAVEAEMGWLNSGPEPDWPSIADTPPVLRAPHTLRMTPSGFEAEFTVSSSASRENVARFDHQAAAQWMGAVCGTFRPAVVPWIYELIDSYSNWTARANGAGAAKDMDPDRPPAEWNNQFYRLAAWSILQRQDDIVEDFVGQVSGLPDKPFSDVGSALLHASDVAFYNAKPPLPNDRAERVRALLSTRMIQMGAWTRAPREGELNIDRRLTGIVSTLFMCNHDPFGRGTSSYLVPAVFDRVDPMLGAVRPLVAGGPTPFVAVCVMNLLEVVPLARHAEFLLTSAEAWLARAPRDQGLWFELGIGKRVAKWIDAAAQEDASLLSPENPLRARIEAVLGQIASFGISEALELETKIQAVSR